LISPGFVWNGAIAPDGAGLFWFDCNGDGQHTPGDPLRIINAINGDQLGPSLELSFVDARSLAQVDAGSGPRPVMLRGKARDDLTGLAALYVQIGEETPVPISFNPDGDFVYIPPETAGRGAGPCTVRLIATDSHGNRTDYATTIFVAGNGEAPSSEPSPTYLPPDDSGSTQFMVRHLGDLQDAEPVVVVGDPNGTPAVTPDDRIDPNLPSSAFAGVVSILTASDGGTSLCTGTLLAKNKVLTAAHCFDVIGGVRSDGNPTGDGQVDYAPSDVTVVFNHDNLSRTAGEAIIVNVSAISLHPDWHGFVNVNASEGATVNDDLAVLTLSSAAPLEVPVYPLATNSRTMLRQVLVAGYGKTGNGIDGFQAAYPSPYVKRTGQNLPSRFVVDDEAPLASREVFLSDFDGPDQTTDTFHDGGTLGNAVEVTIGPGDSGGPSFLWNDRNGNLAPESGELELYGVNTFAVGGGSLPDAPRFGSSAGGILTDAYLEFIVGQVSSAAPPPVIAPQEVVSANLELHWSGGWHFTEFWIFTGEDTWDLNDRAHKLTFWGNPQTATVRGLAPGTYWITGCTGWQEDGQWVTTPWSDRVPYTVLGGPQSPVIAPQDVLSSKLELRWTEGGSYNEFWIFTSEDTWNLNDRAQRLTLWGNPQSATVRGLASGTYWVTGCTGWEENGRWVTAPWSERVPYTVLDGPQSPVIAPQEVVSSNLDFRWTEGGSYNEFWIFTSEDTWDLNDRPQRLAIWGNPQNATVRGLAPGTYWVTGCTGWEENGQWVTAPWSERVPYTVLEGPQSPVIAPQEVVSSNLELHWTKGGPYTEFWIFTDKGTWDLNDRVQKLSFWGNPQSATVRGLAPGTYWVTGCTGWEENGQWATTPWSDRVPYTVTEGTPALAVTASNSTTPTLCAECDNVNVPLSTQASLRSFVIESTHPLYEVGTDNGDPNFDNCPPPGESYPFPAGQLELYNNGNTIMVAVREAEFWRPTGMTATATDKTLTDAHYVRIHKKIAGVSSWPEVAVFYADGNLRLKPQAPLEMHDTLFGSSVIVGPADSSDRPFIDVGSIEYVPATDSLQVTYRTGGAATIRFVSVDRTATRVEVLPGYDTSAQPFATFRSMFIAEGNADIDHVEWTDPDRDDREANILDFTRTTSESFMFCRDVRSVHNTSAPDIRIGEFQFAEEAVDAVFGDDLALASLL
jgi:type 1 glutamine amidotransferase